MAAGIMVGGAGAVFWMLISSLFAMIIKYAECVLTLNTHGTGGSGMHHVIKRLFPRAGTALSFMYALLCAALSLLMGGAMQSGAVVDTATSTIDISVSVAVALFVVFVVLGIFRGGDEIEKITVKIIPIATFVYILMSFCAIFVNFHALPDTVSSIIISAFAPRAALGGTAAGAFLLTLREGYARGILSNEAGTGTSAMAHSRAAERTPTEAGVCGICEVFFDTVVLCPLTALVILTSGCDASTFSTPMSLVSRAFSKALGSWSSLLLLGAILIFAYSTVICWYYYGSECVSYLFGKGAAIPFLFLFLISVVVGGTLTGLPLICVTDTVLLLMSVLTSAAILRGMSDICRGTRDGGLL